MIDLKMEHQEVAAALERLRRLALEALNRAPPEQRPEFIEALRERLNALATSLTPPPPRSR
jgi:hypothetical protein